MKLVVESGATKTAWRSLSSDGAVREALTAGLSPTCLDEEHCRDIIREAVPVLNPSGETVEHVYFYGAGLVSEESVFALRSCMDMWCPFATVEFHSDILAAARALFGDGSGVVAIMGTGSNSCLYKDGGIVRNIRPGGFILGDEGGGASLGKAFLADFVKGLLPSEIDEELVAETGLDYAQVVRKVYKEPAASAFMASFAPFIMKRIEHPYMYRLVYECLESFVVRALSRYSLDGDPDTRKIGVVGSLGCACKEILEKIGEEHGVEFVKFLKSPIDELVKYHGI
ncbi:MAG: hypothetical protein IKU33_01765 [Bacteroidales bacterium]|nr:hypothetical protein [Bacteroidales bacterium]